MRNSLPVNETKANNLIYDTRFSSDGKLVAIGGADGLLKVWDLETGKVLDLPGHKEGYVHVLFHPFERRLISADTEGIINLWQPEDLNQALKDGGVNREDEPIKPKSLLGHQGSITRIQFSADGSYLASASVDDTIRLWLTEDGTLLDVMRGHEDEVLNLAYSPERGGKYGEAYLASSGRDGTIRLWQVNNDVRPLRHENRLYDIAFHPDGKVLAASGRGTVSLWRLADYKLLGRVSLPGTKPTTEIFSVHYSPSGELLAAGDSEGRITLWQHPVDEYYSIKAEQEEKEEQKPYRQWSAIDAPDQGTTPSGEVTVVRFHPNSQIIASGSTDGVVRFWNTEGKLLGQQSIGPDGYAVTSLDFSRDGEHLAVAARAKVTEDSLVSNLRVGGGHIETYRVNVADQLSKVSLRNVATIAESASEAHSKGILTIAFNPVDSNEFASGGEDGQVKIWAMQGDIIKTLDGQGGEAKDKNNGSITRVDYSQDGQMMVASGEDGTIKFWDLDTGRMISSLKRHERQVSKVIFNPKESTMLASAGFDAQVLIWKIPENFHEKPMQKLVAKGCLSADKYLALLTEEENSEIFEPRISQLEAKERDIRKYCLNKPEVKARIKAEKGMG